ncbi:MAG: GNAT family N-acetyltransferase [Rhodobacteraceae bacterium]|jgi:putative hemolysin|nr:GNAT family N-acetyltransferase [Paracoccaceae bacterium]
MLSLSKGRYTAREATCPADVARAQRLRHLAFRAGRHDAHGAAGLPARTPRDMPGGTLQDDALDADAFDSLCTHVLVEEAPSGALVACFRLLPLSGGHEIARSYSAQFYDLSALAGFRGRLVEVGRFCLHPDSHDPDILRLAWGAMTAWVDREGVELLFGCSSFLGIEAEAHAEAFALLTARHLAPRRWWPRAKAPEVVRFARRLAGRTPDLKRAMQSMPPLLRTYLAMGGWVSDHAVVDRDLGTMHVFTGVEIGKVPPARARLLRALAS